MTTFTDTDLLDSMMRAAFDPKPVYLGMGYDNSGNPTPQYGETPAFIAPLISVVKQKLDSDEAFRALLTAKIMERIDEIAERIVQRATADSSAFGIARKATGGWNNQSAGFELADWLQEPLGTALAQALTPALTEHFEKDGAINLDNAQLNITVEVQPWPKAT